MLMFSNAHVLNDWNSGKLRYFTQPPENSKQVDVGSAQFCSSQLLDVFSKEFDLDALDDEQKVLVEGWLFTAFIWYANA
ncbi:unnamed protein product [Toxocara canis]|uniref:ULP_PROTEASE domain-containing protein n=1 Tax=Toxocara canis TaxID=6265 RepID=A0A183U9P1_TOXCA|nr:unnamed protein product [Toxocara canis]